MLQDVMQGRSTEIDSLNEAIARVIPKTHLQPLTATQKALRDTAFLQVMV